MTNISYKGVNWQVWVFGLMQTFVGFILLDVHSSYKEKDRAQTEINAITTKTLYDIQSQLKINERDKIYYERDYLKISKEVEQLRNDVNQLQRENKKN